MGAPLEPVLAIIVMTSLEEYVIPTPKSPFFSWKPYVDDAYACVKPTKVEFI